MGSLRGARRLHDHLLARILSLRMAWFDTVPFGRLSNRFSKDVEVQASQAELCIGAKPLVLCILPACSQS